MIAQPVASQPGIGQALRVFLELASEAGERVLAAVREGRAIPPDPMPFWLAIAMGAARDLKYSTIDIEGFRSFGHSMSEPAPPNENGSAPSNSIQGRARRNRTRMDHTEVIHRPHVEELPIDLVHLNDELPRGTPMNQMHEVARSLGRRLVLRHLFYEAAFSWKCADRKCGSMVFLLRRMSVERDAGETIHTHVDIGISSVCPGSLGNELARECFIAAQSLCSLDGVAVAQGRVAPTTTRRQRRAPEGWVFLKDAIREYKVPKSTMHDYCRKLPTTDCMLDGDYHERLVRREAMEALLARRGLLTP